MSTKFKASEIKNLPVGRYAIGEGLSLVVKPTSRSWIFRFSFDHKRQEMSLGNANAVSLSEAKRRLTAAKPKLIDGINPKSLKRTELEENIASGNSNLFRDNWKSAIDNIQNVKRWRNKKHVAQWYSTIEQYALPYVADLEIDKITRDDILRVSTPIWTTKAETAPRVRGRLENIFSFFIVKGLCQFNPATWKGNLEFFLAPVSKIMTPEHHASISHEELKEKSIYLMPRSQSMPSLCSLSWRRAELVNQHQQNGVNLILKILSGIFHLRSGKTDKNILTGCRYQKNEGAFGLSPTTR